jgi:hypothetical protein
MPVYQFYNDGGTIERAFRVSECPEFIEEQGQRFKKVSAYRVGVVCDGHGSKWEDNKHRDAAVKEAHRSAKYIRENPDAWPVTIGANDGAKTPDFVKSEFDWARKNG